MDVWFKFSFHSIVVVVVVAAAAQLRLFSNFFFVNRIALDGENLNGLCGSQNEAHFAHSLASTGFSCRSLSKQMLVRRLIVNVVNFYSSQAIVVKREIYRICEAAIVMCYILRLFETEIGSAVRSGQSSAGGRPTRRTPRSPGTARHSND